jgi:hypothetical protein
MKLSEMFPSEFLSAADFEEESRTLRIKRIDKDVEVGKDKDLKTVVYFAEEERGLVLNKTNAATIFAITGTTDSKDWIDKSIVLFHTMVPFGNEMKPAIRIRAVKSGPRREFAPKSSEPEYDEDGYPVR